MRVKKWKMPKQDEVDIYKDMDFDHDYLAEMEQRKGLYLERMGSKESVKDKKRAIRNPGYPGALL